jgi:hypothetical protein
MGYVILEKYNKNHFLWKDLVNKKPSIEFKIEDILTKYNGFEGTFLLVKDFENKYHENHGKIKDFDIYLEFYKKNKNDYINFLYLNNKIQNIEKIINKKFIFVGIEFGYCKNEFIVYSSIFNEIIFGVTEELISYKKHLNDNLLFPSKDICLSYKELHNNLFKKDKKVEEDHEMKVYEIWKYME